MNFLRVIVAVVLAIGINMYTLATLLRWCKSMAREFSIFGLVPAAALSLIVVFLPWAVSLCWMVYLERKRLHGSRMT